MKFVVKWDNLRSRWQIHELGSQFDLFDIEQGVGYFLLTESAGNYWIRGVPSSGSVPIIFRNGWNLVSVSSLSAAYNSETLAQDMTGSGIPVRYVVRWEKLLGRWQIHEPGSQFAIFEIERGAGYFIRTESDGIWTPD